jgi:hypothetical protein
VSERASFLNKCFGWGGADEVALELDPVYTKALHRCATANDRIGSWSSLTSAKEGELFGPEGGP